MTLRGKLIQAINYLGRGDTWKEKLRDVIERVEDPKVVSFIEDVLSGRRNSSTDYIRSTLNRRLYNGLGNMMENNDTGDFYHRIGLNSPLDRLMDKGKLPEVESLLNINTYRYYKKGSTELTCDTYREICDVLGLNYEYIMTGTAVVEQCNVDLGSKVEYVESPQNDEVEESEDEYNECEDSEETAYVKGKLKELNMTPHMLGSMIGSRHRVYKFLKGEYSNPEFYKEMIDALDRYEKSPGYDIPLNQIQRYELTMRYISSIFKAEIDMTELPLDVRNNEVTYIRDISEVSEDTVKVDSSMTCMMRFSQRDTYYILFDLNRTGLSLVERIVRYNENGFVRDMSEEVLFTLPMGFVSSSLTERRRYWDSRIKGLNDKIEKRIKTKDKLVKEFNEKMNKLRESVLSEYDERDRDLIMRELCLEE